MKTDFSNAIVLDDLKNQSASREIDDIFKNNIKGEDAVPEIIESSEDELKINAVDEGLDISLGTETQDLGMMDLSLDDGGDGADLQLGELSLNSADGLMDNFGELDFQSTPEESPAKLEEDISELNLATEINLSANLSETDLKLSDGEDLETLGDNLSSDLSEDAKEKLKEIDAIMDLDASQANLRPDFAQLEKLGSEAVDSDNLDVSLVSEDLDLEGLNFGGEVVEAAPEKPKKKKKEKEVSEVKQNISAELKEISGAYTGEMERLHATVSNLRADREELLTRINSLEEEKALTNRQNLSLRAELDEKKIELTIIRKKLNEEINELKDKQKLHDEKRLILEEKNKFLQQELDKASQKSKFDLKKIHLREQELEQKLELLKADAETQIKHRDLKILELKRKIDAMEFDMESISMQEKRSVESRFELEDKLDKAIKTLRGAISELEDEPDRARVLEALKKNIDM